MSSPGHIHAHSDRLPFGCLLYMYRLDLTPVDNPQVPVGKFSLHILNIDIVTEPYLQVKASSQVLTRRANIGRLEPPLKREVVSWVTFLASTI